MAKLTRFNQLVFGTSAGTDQMGEFGSKAAGTPSRYTGTTITPAIVQTLANYVEGWFAAILGVNSPAIEDMNALCYLFSYQLTYLFQSGIAEWNADAIYFIGSFVSDGSGNLYVSITNSNTNNVVTDVTKWKKYVGAGNTQTKTNGQSYSVLPSDGAVRVSGTNTQTLPLSTTVLGQIFYFKKTDGSGTNTLAFSGGETADGQTTLTLTLQYSYWGLRAYSGGYDIVAGG